MSYSLKIIETKISNEGYTGNKSLSGPNNCGKLLVAQNDKFIISNKKELTLVDSCGNSIWEQNIKCPGTPNNAWISGNRLLVTTNSDQYHAWGHLGPAVLIDLYKGTILKELRGAQGAALSNGEFLLGLEGYDVFDTWMYDANGKVMKQWRSFGHYIIGEKNDLRVVEQDRNEPTNAHVVRLNPDETIQKGVKLETSYASKPIVFTNGDIAFINSGKLKIIDSELNLKQELQLLKIAKSESGRCVSKLQFHKRNLKVEIFELAVNQKYEWLIEL